ncbi:Ribonuclease 2 [Morus notabilis]|uniref:Ribonuclease 2 n=1 Tax=Morus notabilis TaxID=981085 RepID=W9QWM1_9ROSA|nr:Ribonuclease 2 [Morus notabilis]
MAFRLLSVKLACLTILAVASCGIIKANGIGDRIGIMEVKGQREFDYFALALQWPPTYCRHTRDCCSSNACCRGANAPSEFTIHGLWPDYNDGTWPACCTRESFNEKEISTLLDALEKYWPSLSCGKPRACHEKHGTCSSPVVHDEYSYFVTALNVYLKYNVTKVLSEEGYVPSNTEKYPLGGIVSAIQNAFHATPSLACKNGAIEELQLCFYKDFKPRDCLIKSTSQKGRGSSSSCPNYVSLPTYVSSGVDRLETTVPWVTAEEAIEEFGSM